MSEEGILVIVYISLLVFMFCVMCICDAFKTRKVIKILEQEINKIEKQCNNKEVKNGKI